MPADAEQSSETPDASVGFLEDVQAWNDPDPLPGGTPTREEDAFDHAYANCATAFEAIIRGHLWVQSAIIQYVETELANPNDIDLARMDFSVLVDLAIALGLIVKEDSSGYKKLNGLRNRFAHNLMASIALQDAVDLYNSLGIDSQRQTGMTSLKPFGDEHINVLIYRSIKVLYFRPVKERRFLAALKGPSVTSETEGIQPDLDERPDLAEEVSQLDSSDESVSRSREGRR